LLNAVLDAIPTFAMAALELPPALLRAIEALRRAFLWNVTGAVSGTKCLVSWEVVCRPKPEGGLGIKCLTTKKSVCNSSLCTGCGPGLTRRGRDRPGVMSLATLSLGSMMIHKYRGSQQSSREVKPKFIDLTQGEPKDIYKA
jgi:hypothetical protein